MENKISHKIRIKFGTQTSSSVTIQHGDFNSHMIQAVCYEPNGTPANFEDKTVYVVYRVGTEPSEEYDVTISDNMLEFVLPSFAAKTAGIGEMQIRVYGDGSLLQSAIIPYDVRLSIEPGEGAEDPTPALTLLVIQGQQAVAKTNEAIDNANNAATLANEKASFAEEAANLAFEAATNATLATDKATEATQNVNAAVESAQNAAFVANSASVNATKSAERAETAASLAENSAFLATSATENADQAAKNANAAASTVDEAKASAIDAANKANTATTNANAAASNANEKAQMANNAAASANTAANNAIIATGNANTASGAASSSAVTADQAAKNANDAAAYANQVASYIELKAENGDFNGAPGLDAPQINDTQITTTNPWSSMQIVKTLCPPFTASGSVVQCTPIANSPMDVQVEITPTQEGEGDPSPENVRPIVGWNSINVAQAGKNLVGRSSKNTWRGSKSYWGIDLSELTKLPVTLSIHLKDGASIPSNAYFGFIFKNGANDKTNAIWCIQSGSVQKTTYTYNSTNFVHVGLGVNPGTQETWQAIFDACDIQLELGSTASDYEPYIGDMLTAVLGQTIYGGTLDVGTGECTIKSKKLLFNGSENWKFGQNDNGYILKGSENFVQNSLAICNIAKATTKTQTNGYWLRIAYDYFRFQGFADVYKTVDDFKAFLQTQNAVIVAELVSPITVQLTPQQILAFSGTNTIYADAGAVTVSGLSDPVATIASLQSRVSALENAQTNM